MNVLKLETKKYAIKIDNFEGPLDLLCHLIEKNKMKVSEINLSQITDQYIEYINEQEKMNLEIASEFILMAATLMYLKSKELLPKQIEDEDEITEDELIRRIIEYKKIKEASEKLAKNLEIFANRKFKNPEELELPKKELEDKEYEKNIISNIYEEMLKRNRKKINVNAKNIEKIALVETFSVSSKVKELLKELLKNKKIVFNKMFSIDKKSKQEVITAFSGLLELSKRDKIETSQERLFGDIIAVKKIKNKK